MCSVNKFRMFCRYSSINTTEEFRLNSFLWGSPGSLRSLFFPCFSAVLLIRSSLFISIFFLNIFSPSLMSLKFFSFLNSCFFFWYSFSWDIQLPNICFHLCSADLISQKYAIFYPLPVLQWLRKESSPFFLKTIETHKYLSHLEES